MLRGPRIFAALVAAWLTTGCGRPAPVLGPPPAAPWLRKVTLDEARHAYPTQARDPAAAWLGMDGDQAVMWHGVAQALAAPVVEAHAAAARARWLVATALNEPPPWTVPIGLIGADDDPRGAAQAALMQALGATRGATGEPRARRWLDEDLGQAGGGADDLRGPGGERWPRLAPVDPSHLTAPTAPPSDLVSARRQLASQYPLLLQARARRAVAPDPAALADAAMAAIATAEATPSDAAHWLRRALIDARAVELLTHPPTPWPDLAAVPAPSTPAANLAEAAGRTDRAMAFALVRGPVDESELARAQAQALLEQPPLPTVPPPASSLAVSAPHVAAVADWYRQATRLERAIAGRRPGLPAWRKLDLDQVDFALTLAEASPGDLASAMAGYWIAESAHLHAALLDLPAADALALRHVRWTSAEAWARLAAARARLVLGEVPLAARLAYAHGHTMARGTTAADSVEAIVAMWQSGLESLRAMHLAACVVPAPSQP